MPYDEEPQRVLGFPVHKGIRSDDGVEQRFMGFPVKKSGTPIDTRWARHPVVWTKWRLRVRREGPYAPTFDDILHRG